MGTGHERAGDAAGQEDFFVCDFFAAVPKHDLASMEHPLFSLSTRPDRRILNYAHNDTEITVTPSVKGRATIFDADILIFCISQLMAAINAGKPMARSLTLTAHDLLLATGRETSGDGYRRLRDAFERLAGTRITTNIVTGTEETTTGFGLIESWEIVRRTRAGRMVRRERDPVGLALPRGAVEIGADAEPGLFHACASRWSGGFTNWRASTAAGSRSGASRWRCCARRAARPPRRVFRAMLREIIRADRCPTTSWRGGRATSSRQPAGRDRGGPGSGPLLRAETLEAARAPAPRARRLRAGGGLARGLGAAVAGRPCAAPTRPFSAGSPGVTRNGAARASRQWHDPPVCEAEELSSQGPASRPSGGAKLPRKPSVQEGLAASRSRRKSGCGA